MPDKQRGKGKTGGAHKQAKGRQQGGHVQSDSQQSEQTGQFTGQ
jgi:hypothetical protein